MQKAVILLFLCFFCSELYAQNYTEYLTGNSTDMNVNPDFGICLMGGATESDTAMQWFLNRANGGDVVVLRASGSDGYNDYFYTQLGVTINSVRTFVINNEAGATDPYVVDSVEKAEAIWFAGGDQYNYVSYFKDNALEVALNNFVNVKGGIIGGTSAGMAILGDHYFDAEHGTVTSAEALANPYDNKVSIGQDDFLQIPFMNSTITDTHFDDPDRRGRLTTFLARLVTDNSLTFRAYASEEYTAICIDENGLARVFGEYPDYQDYAYFIQPDCSVMNISPETCLSNTPLTWNNSNQALFAYKVPGTINGDYSFDVSTWIDGTGGSWENWYAVSGTLSTVSITESCNALSIPEASIVNINVFPNPFLDEITIEGMDGKTEFKLYNILGKQQEITVFENKINTSQLASGTYFLKVKTDNTTQVFKLIKN